jgi:carboxypeptidase Q
MRALFPLLLMLLAGSQSASARPRGAVIPAGNAASRDAARDPGSANEVAWDIVEGLTTEVGPRPAGTEAEARARRWAVAKLEALGFSNVHVEEFRMPVWVRGAETAEIVSPYPQKMAVTALGSSASTGDVGITAQVVGFMGLDALRAAPAGSLSGKIVFINHAMQPTQDGSGYRAFGPVRFDGPAIAAAKGAAAVVIRSVGTDHHRNPHTGLTDFPAGSKAVPAGALSVPDAENLQRMLARGGPVTMRLVLTPHNLADQPSGNVVAEVPGSDPKAGTVLIGGHLDSWDLGTGAIDDGAGLAITTAAARAMLAAPHRQRRTIRIVWWGAEEVGSPGGNAYFERHRGENVVLVAEADFGADRVWRFQHGFAAANNDLADRIAATLGPLGIARGDNPAHGGADVEKWVESGVAVIDLNQDGTHYFDIHHTPDDTLDKIDPVQLQQDVAAWTALLSIVANDPHPISRRQHQ